MGAAMAKANMREDEKKDPKNENLPDMTKKTQEDLDLLQKSTLDIAITGATGTGKSSLFNALRGMEDEEYDAAVTGIIETTRQPDKYPHPTFPSVAMWDLPGTETSNFKPKEYLKKVNFKEYDCFIIVASERFTKNEVFLAHAIHKMDKKFYYVRSKVDISIASERRKPNFCEEKCLKKIRKNCCDNLKQTGESNPRVFLISSWDLDKYDFPLLQETLANELDDLKREVLILAMPAFSKEILEKKRAIMKAYIKKSAYLSCVVGATPVRGLSVASDLAILMRAMKLICKAFGLDEDSLNRLAKRVGKPVDVLKSAIKKSPLASQVTKEFVFDMLTKSVVCETLKTVSYVNVYLLVVSCVVGGVFSLGTTYYTLKNFLRDAEEDAENIRAEAAEVQPEISAETHIK